LVIGLAIQSTTARAGGSPTYNGVTMSQVGTRQQASTEVTAEMWYLINPTIGGALTISVPNTGGLNIRIIASTATSTVASARLDQNSNTTGTSANPSHAVTTLANGEWIVDVTANSNNSPETGRSQTLLFATDEGVWQSGGQYAVQTNAGSITFTHTITSANWAHIVASFMEVDTKTITATDDLNA